MASFFSNNSEDNAKAVGIGAGIIVGFIFGGTVGAFIGGMAVIIVGGIFRQKQEQKERLAKERSEKEALEYLAREEQERLAARENYISDFIDSPAYEYIEKMQKRLMGNTISEGDINKLLRLLSTKGFNLEEEELVTLLECERDRQGYKGFTSRLEPSYPKTETDYIRNYINIYANEDHYDSNYRKFFIKFLKEKGYTVDEYDLSNKIRSEKEAMELAISKGSPNNSSTNGIITLEELDIMEEYKFEEFLAKLFRRDGYEVTGIPKSDDQGANLIIDRLGDKVVVQAKLYSNNVGNKPVQEVIAARFYYEAHNAMVVSNSYYTESAKDLANRANVELIDRDGLMELINGSYVDY